MSGENVLLFLHILGAFMIVGGAVTDTILQLRGGRTTSTHTLANLADLQLRAERMALLPGAVVAIVFGTWLVPVAGFSFAGWWLSAAYLAWVVMMGVHGVMGAGVRRVHAEAERLVAQGVAESEELRARFAAPRAVAMRWVIDALILVFLYLMVFRPGA